jgi:(1->4)-alpha-D-glucan 1-alpha-D-glucosylmutase
MAGDMTEPPRPPRATYRVQLHAGFDLDAATRIVPYLARLGISHLYASPILQAEAGSTHGYDVVDHSRINSELGGAPALDRLVAALRRHGMGLVVDVVPNHMAISPANRWWWDVLAHGPASGYARYFDVDWDPPESRLRNVILLPVLPDHYGRVLEAGELRLQRHDAEVRVVHADQRWPLDPRSLAPLVVEAGERSASEELAFIGRALGDLPPTSSPRRSDVERRQADSAVLGERLAALLRNPPLAAALDDVVRAVNADPDRLDALLEEQSYRLARWRASSRDLGYRRFFDINSLVGLRVEDPEVFDATHRLILERVAAGDIAGLRIDHPDGLRDPAGYFARLREAAPTAWIVAEKILERDEILPDWPIDGTTGYGFANLATGLLVDPAGEGPMTDAYVDLAAAEASWPAVAHEARLLALSASLGSDVNRLSDLWLSICEAHRRYRDFTRHELHEALQAVAASFGVYRTYVRPAQREVAAQDRAAVEAAVSLARERRPDLDPELFAFLGSILLLDVPGPAAAELAMRFQQLTPAAMAKGVEDTAFYRYLRLVALNEVGGDPDRFGVAPDAFHAVQEADANRWPAGMLATSTHDTKRSEDVRARLALVSEVPDAWRSGVERLAARAAPHRSGPDLPGAAAEYLLLQTLVGAWPIDAERALAYLRKAMREAKERTSWTAPAPDYEDALERLVRGCLQDEAFLAALQEVVAPLVVPGRVNALAQVLWKLTAPGVPDVYQGTELWDLSLVDPDNRRPVDYAARERLLAGARVDPPAVDADDGAAKLWLTHRALAVRAGRANDFAPGAPYRSLWAEGAAAEHAVAYRRGEGVVAVAQRLPLRLAAAGGWRDTILALPEGRWCNRLDGSTVEGEVRLAELLAAFPVALLERQA